MDELLLPGEISYFKYVAIAEIGEYQAKGWVVVGNRPDHHSYYSVTMEWTGKGETPEVAPR
jgi:hypothetical protein